MSGPDRPVSRVAGSDRVAGGTGEDAAISRLRRQVRELEMERDILRRAAKYFAKETNW
jgi:transposase